ncbi:hypothetical protein AB0I16_33220 [Streptomyces sp. NPDC050703]|uniref:hypothetical protein n=1 Tax=Streptomyces sp. NPDC050703 TaxID=3157218 RepID=UPI00343923AC
MAEYEIFQVEARSGNVIASLPFTGLSYGEALNAAGSCTVGIPLDAADPETLAPGRSGIVVVRDGEPDWGGLLWTAQADLAAGALTLNSAGWHSYYAGRVLEDGYKTRGSDQAFMLRRWLDTCNEDGGIDTDTSAITSAGKQRVRNWTKYEFKVVADAIAELADESGGFHFRYETYWRNKKRTRVGNRFYRFALNEFALPFTLTHRGNCDVTQVSYDAAAMVTHAYAVGADAGNGKKLVGTATNSIEMPKKQVVTTFSDVKKTSTLTDKARAIAEAGRSPVAIPALNLYPGVFRPADFIVGTAGFVKVDAGYVRVNGEYVLTERKTDVDENGTEVTALSLANREVFISGD